MEPQASASLTPDLSLTTPSPHHRNINQTNIHQAGITHTLLYPHPKSLLKKIVRLSFPIPLPPAFNALVCLLLLFTQK